MRNIAIELSSSKTSTETIALKMPFTVMLRILLIRLVSQVGFSSVCVSIAIAHHVIFQRADHSNPPSQPVRGQCWVQ
jgi:hypothetical protein